MSGKGKVLETVVKVCGELSPTLGKSMKEATKSLDGINFKAIGIGAAFVGGAGLAVKAIVDVTKSLNNLGKEFDSAYDAIRIGTGATGEALEGLKNDFKDVYSSVPATMDEASKAVADYNTRLDITGDVLSGVSKQAIQTSKMLSEDLGGVIENSSKAFKQWKIPADAMGKEMDYLFKVSQSTGVGFNALSADMQRFGPQLQQMGYSFDSAATFIGQLGKAGVDTTEVLGAMKKGVGVLAKEGYSASDGMAIFYSKIKNAKSEIQATTIASEIFGARAGSSMAAAIRSGALAIGDLTQSLQDSTESIDKAYWDAADYPEKMQLLGQKMQVAFEPLGMAIFDALGDIVPIFSDIMEQIAPIITDFANAAIPIVKDIFGKMSELWKSLEPVITDMAKNVFPALLGIIEELLPPFLEIISAVLPPIISLVKALTPVIVILAKVLSTVLSQAIKILVPLFESIMGILTNVIDFVTNVFTLKWGDAWQNVVGMFDNIFKLLVNYCATPVKIVIGIINSLISGINALNIKIPDWVPGMGGKEFKIEIPQIPMPTFAEGGFTSGPSIAGEDGTEAIISFNPSYKDDNLSIWAKAGQMLGVGDLQGASSSSTIYDLSGLSFSPQISMSGDADPDELIKKLKEAGSEFFDMLDDWLERKKREQYA